MTTEQFWEIYKKGNILKIYDKAYDFFSRDLPADFLEDYDVGEVLLEIRGHHEDAKEFEKVLQFTELIHNKHPELYNEYFQYFDDFLVEYHCFHKNKKEVENALANFIQYPVKNYDSFLIVLKKILYYDYVDILDKIIVDIFDIIKNSDELMQDATFDLAINKYYITLEKYHNESDDNNKFDTNQFTKSLMRYDFELKDDIHTSLEYGLSIHNLPKETIKDLFEQNNNDTVLIIQGLFLKEMKSRNFSFALSGNLWDKMFSFLDDQSLGENLEPDEYFLIETADFEQYIAELSGNYFVNQRSEMFAMLWGSVYIYDFLLAIGIINQETYDSFKETSKILKGKVIGQFTSELWNSDFVHHWSKPDSISENEFREEEKIFQKSFGFKPLDFSKLSDKIKEELDHIGELSKYIINGARSVKSNSKNRGGYFADNFPKQATIRTEKKVGRNEPCPCGSGKKYKKCCG
jgi:SEC-C motif